MIQAKFLLALDRNAKVLSPIEMSVHRKEAVCREALPIYCGSERCDHTGHPLPRHGRNLTLASG
ncbi:MAG: hypothetical protein JWM54_348 [Acidobacteriaceae bacterium]|nr:hypothetical protein [Acidobacteriaceae bacterium]